MFENITLLIVTIDRSNEDSCILLLVVGGYPLNEFVSVGGYIVLVKNGPKLYHLKKNNIKNI